MVDAAAEEGTDEGSGTGVTCDCRGTLTGGRFAAC